MRSPFEGNIDPIDPSIGSTMDTVRGRIAPSESISSSIWIRILIGEGWEGEREGGRNEEGEDGGKIDRGMR